MEAIVVTMKAAPKTSVIFFVKVYTRPAVKKNNNTALKCDFVICIYSEKSANAATINNVILLLTNLLFSNLLLNILLLLFFLILLFEFLFFMFLYNYIRI